MLILGISTSFSDFALVLAENDKILFNSRHFDSLDTYRLEILLNYGLSHIKCGVNEIGQVIVDNGPGGTSSVRTGVAFANTIAYCLNIEVIPVSSFALLGLDIYHEFDIPVLLSAKSIKGNFFWGYFDNHKLQSLTYGMPGTVLPEILNGVESIAVSSLNKEAVQQIKPSIQLREYDRRPGDIENLIKYRESFAAKPMKYPEIVNPITENNLIYG